jgi:CRP/FNR family transcriptional regulator
MVDWNVTRFGNHEWIGRAMWEGTSYHRQQFRRRLSEHELALVRSIGLGTASAAANRDIVRAGEVGGHVFLLVEGWAFRYIRLGEGRRQILSFLLPGDCFGLQSGLLGMIGHSVQALTPARLCLVDSRRLDALFVAHPQFALAVAKLLAAEERASDRRLAVVGRGTAMQRVAFLLLDLYGACDARGLARGNECPFPLRRQHIADAVGLTGAHVNRTLRALRERGLALIQKASLALPDRVMLHRIVNGDVSQTD